MKSWDGDQERWQEIIGLVLLEEVTSKDAKRGVFDFDIVEGLYPMIETSDFLE